MKVVIPAAGVGVRFLPETKSMPKEMLPIVDRPVIQYVVAEAVASGADDVLIITGRTKRAIEDHFDQSPELSHIADLPALRELERLAERVRLHYIRQRSPQGLADALGYAERHIGHEPFGVLLGDTINVCDPPLLTQLRTVFERRGGSGSVVAIEPVPDEKVGDYGIVGGTEVEPGVLDIRTFVEKPSPSEAPSRFGITGAYLLTPGIFDAIRETPPGRHGEVQLTDALARLARREKVYGVTFRGTRYDIGDRYLWLRTNVEFALRDPEVGDRLRAYLREAIR